MVAETKMMRPPVPSGFMWRPFEESALRLAETRRAGMVALRVL